MLDPTTSDLRDANMDGPHAVLIVSVSHAIVLAELAHLLGVHSEVAFRLHRHGLVHLRIEGVNGKESKRGAGE